MRCAINDNNEWKQGIHKIDWHNDWQKCTMGNPDKYFVSQYTCYIFDSILQGMNTMCEHDEWTQWVNILSAKNEHGQTVN